MKRLAFPKKRLRVDPMGTFKITNAFGGNIREVSTGRQNLGTYTNKDTNKLIREFKGKTFPISGQKVAFGKRLRLEVP